MKKSDLKTGMRITMRNDGVYFVMLGLKSTRQYDSIDAFVSKNGWMGLKDYDDDFNCIDEDASEYDIVKIETPFYVGETFNKEGGFETTWVREEPIAELTIEEIQERLGYKIKVVESHR